MTNDGEHRPAVKQRDMKGAVAFWIAALTVGVCLLIIGNAGNGEILMPGPLTPAHRAATGCESCHSNVGKEALGWVHGILAKADSRADNKRCLNCHSLGDKPHMPHGLAAPQLKAITEANKKPAEPASFIGRAADVALLNASFAGAGRKQSEIACAVCHGEHRGADAVANADAATGCNTCHLSRFKSFQDGHPDFGGYPFHRSTSIKFDHRKHFAKNFEEARSKRPDLKAPPAACSDCHEVGSDGHKMGNKPFAKTCSACHLPQIIGADRATGPKGLSLITLPGIDLETMAERNAPIGSWPSESEADVAPLMRVLLGRDQERRALLSAIDQLDLQDLSAANDAQIAQVTALVWEIKQLIHELMTSNATSLLRRIRDATGGRVSREEIADLLGTLPRDVLAAAQKAWLPSLEAEIAIRSKPGWEKKLRAKAETERDGPKSPELAEPPEPPPQTELVANPKGGRWYVSVLGEIVQEGLEARETLDAARGELDSPKRNKRLEPGGGHDAAAVPAAAKEASGTSGDLRKVDDETWSEFGGWYRKDHAILYRPSGHADRVLQTWINVSAKKDGDDTHNLLGAVFDWLSDKDATGRCTKCHSVETGDDGSVRINWQPERNRTGDAGFTTFAHMPHFSLLDGKGCLTCHKLDESKDLEAAKNSAEPQPPASSFQPVAKATCAKCHGEGGAPQECGHCHNYHVQKTSTPIADTRLPVQKSRN